MSGYMYLALILIAGLILVGYRAFAVSKTIEEKTSENEKD